LSPVTTFAYTTIITDAAVLSRDKLAISPSICLIVSGIIPRDIYGVHPLIAVIIWLPNSVISVACDFYLLCT